jgi:hypothetical protein
MSKAQRFIFAYMRPEKIASTHMLQLNYIVNYDRLVECGVDFMKGYEYIN